jgi:cytidine deaminase
MTSAEHIPQPVSDPGPLQALLDAARAASLHAYAPYSRFHVGAAVMDEQGRIHAGCNVENAAYPQGTCAEAAAVAAMVLAGGRVIHAVAVAADGPLPVTPCGGCRQKLNEFASADATLLMADSAKVHGQLQLSTLLPLGFGPAHVGI